MRAGLAVLVLALTGCAPPPGAVAAPVEPPAQPAVAEAVEETREAVANTVLPAATAVQDAVQQIVPPAPPRPHGLSDLAVDMLVGWEVTSIAYYNRHLRWPIWPRGASGITWCIGYDGGHQTRTIISSDWAGHQAVDRLVTTAGIRGNAARDALPRYRDIETDIDLCRKVFERVTLPRYETLARRIFSNGWSGLPQEARDSLALTVQNRGGSMEKVDRRLEMRNLRDDCVPRGDLVCMARNYRAMCRHWRGTTNGPGLCRRYDETARLVERALHEH